MTMSDSSEFHAHRATYDGVIKLLKYGAIACFLIVFFVLWLLRG